MMKLFTLVLSLIIWFSNSAYSQTFSNRETVTQATEWFVVTSNIKVHKRIGILAEGQFRYVGTFDPMQFQFRTGADININKNLSVMPLGYVYIWNPIYGKQPASFVNNEHRIFEQVAYKHKIGRFNISHRARLEQRYVEVHEANNSEIINRGYELYLNRARYRLMVNVPLNHATMEPQTLYASLYNEIFVEWGRNVVYHKPDQNRVFVGLGYQFTKTLSVQTGFFYQMLIKLSGVKQEDNIGFQLQVNYNIDLSKKDN
jgi:Protein of unknown function (DUF2490)